MKFRTEISLDRHFELNPQDKIITLGSCFADRMGRVLAEFDLDCDVNPFGVLYNPLSIARLIKKSLDPTVKFPEWTEVNGHWINLMYHGSISDTDKSTAVTMAADAHDVTSSYLKEASLLIVTFGTAFTYFLNETEEAVTSCHRLSAEKFSRRLLKPEDIISTWKPLAEKLKEANPALNIVFTVSPVRHVRDSLVENNFSKSVLTVAVHELCSSGNIFYFPSYEIMMDDLRDYRFYEENLVHPNSQAMTYIKERFADFCFSGKMAEYANDAEKLKRRLSHRIMKQGPEADKFAKETAELYRQFVKKYPFSKISRD